MQESKAFFPLSKVEPCVPNPIGVNRMLTVLLQLLVPAEGARLIVASDGVWDGFPKDQWLRHARSGNPEVRNVQSQISATVHP
jgi:hypothetical protein